MADVVKPHKKETKCGEGKVVEVVEKV